MAEVKYLTSENIKIFPFGSDRKTDPYGRLLNESNLVRLIKSFVDYDSYVIKYTPSDNNYIVFVIGGYYCECNLTEVIVEGQPLYAYIQLSSDDTNPTLVGNDHVTNGTFTAIKFTYEEPKVFSYFLQLLDTDKNVPVGSKKKFENTSVTNTYTRIDCGHAKGF